MTDAEKQLERDDERRLATLLERAISHKASIKNHNSAESVFAHDRPANLPYDPGFVEINVKFCLSKLRRFSTIDSEVRSSHLN
jgi:hypothetical protein